MSKSSLVGAVIVVNIHAIKVVRVAVAVVTRDIIIEITTQVNRIVII